MTSRVFVSDFSSVCETLGILLEEYLWTYKLHYHFGEGRANLKNVNQDSLWLDFRYRHKLLLCILLRGTKNLLLNCFLYLFSKISDDLHDVIPDFKLLINKGCILFHYLFAIMINLDIDFSSFYLYFRKKFYISARMRRVRKFKVIRDLLSAWKL